LLKFNKLFVTTELSDLRWLADEKFFKRRLACFVCSRDRPP